MSDDKKPDDWMPLDIRAYLGDTAHLTRDEHGGYMLLILAYWMRGSALDDNDRQLATIARATLSEWKRLRLVLAAFFTVRDGKWFHKRVEKELSRARLLVAKKTKAGIAGAEARWGTDSKRNADANGSRIAEAVANAPLKQCLGDAPTPTPTPVSTSLRSVDSAPDGASKPKRKTKSSIPGGFPFQADLDWSRDYWLAKGRADLCSVIGEEVEKFHDHHNGHLTASADWSGSWRTWSRNAIKFNNGAHNGRAQKSTPHERFLAGALSAAEELDAEQS